MEAFQVIERSLSMSKRPCFGLACCEIWWQDVFFWNKFLVWRYGLVDGVFFFFLAGGRIRVRGMELGAWWGVVIRNCHQSSQTTPVFCHPHPLWGWGNILSEENLWDSGKGTSLASWLLEEGIRVWIVPLQTFDYLTTLPASCNLASGHWSYLIPPHPWVQDSGEQITSLDIYVQILVRPSFCLSICPCARACTHAHTQACKHARTHARTSICLFIYRGQKKALNPPKLALETFVSHPAWVLRIDSRFL